MKMAQTFNIVQGKGVMDWIVEATNAEFSPKAQGIGLLKDGELVAGAAYDGWTGPNIFVHQRIIGKPTRAYWKAVFDYPFNGLGCTRLTGTVDASNKEAIKLNEHLGFKEEGRLKDAAFDGGDVIVHVLWKADCKILDWKLK